MHLFVNTRINEIQDATDIDNNLKMVQVLSTSELYKITIKLKFFSNILSDQTKKEINVYLVTYVLCYQINIYFLVYIT